MEHRKLGILIGVIVAVAVTLSIVLFPKLFENYSGTLSLISLLVAIAMFFYQQDREKRIKVEELHDALRRWCNAFKNDIAQIREIMNSDNYEKVTSKSGKTSTTVYLSTKIYDAFIYSGYITHFDTDTQGNLDNLYYKIERNNDNIRRRTDVIIYRDSRGISDAPGTNKVIDNFHELIGDYQEQIIALLDIVEKNMTSELEKIK